MPRYTCRVGPIYSRFGSDFPFELREYLNSSMAIFDKQARHNPAYQWHKWDGYKRFFTSSTASFLTGLTGWVIELLEAKHVTVTLVHDKNESYGPRLPIPKARVIVRDYQEPIIQDGIRIKRGIVQAAVNAGKSEIAMEIVRRLCVPTVYIVPSQRLFDQAIDAFQERLPDLPLGELRGGVFDPQLVTVAMIQTLSQRLGGKRADPDVQEWIKNVECVMMDEVHHGGSKKWSLPFLKATRAVYRYGFSATPLGMSEYRDRMLMGLTGPLFGAVTARDLENRGLSVKTEVRFIKYRQTTNEFDHFTGQDYKTIHMLGIQENEERAAALFAAARQHLIHHERVLVFVDEIDHGNRLVELAPPGLGPKTLYGTERKENRQKIERAFREGTHPLLITTLLKEGVNIPEIDVTINASGRKSEWMTRQQGGRGARTRKGKDRAIIYDFLDATHGILIKHSSERHAAYKKEGYAITLFDLTRTPEND